MTNEPKYNPATYHLDNAAECLAIYYWTGEKFHVERARGYLQMAFQDTLTKEQLDIVAPYQGDDQ